MHIPYKKNRISIAVLLFLLLEGIALRAADKHVLPALSAERIEAIEAVLDDQPRGFAEPINNREAWDRYAKDFNFKRIIERANEMLLKPPPHLDDELYLSYLETGKREPYGRPYKRRTYRLTHFVLAECVENSGKYIDAIQNEITAILSEKVWVVPAHDADLRVFSGEVKWVELGAATRAWNLATASWLLADRLPDELHDQVRDTIQERIVDPYLQCIEDGRMHAGMSWMMTNYNWNTVCTSGVVGAALAVIPSKEIRATLIAQAEVSMERYLSGYSEDGYTSEGLNYWNYGFGHFVLLAEAIALSTEGKLSPYDLPKAKIAAHFPINYEIANEIFPTFSDVAFYDKPKGWLMDFVSTRFGVPVHGSHVGRSKDLAISISFGGTLHAAAAVLSLDETFSETIRSEADAMGLSKSGFPKADIHIFRYQPEAGPVLGAVIKGGNNDEFHNHNDVGSYCIVSGDEMLLVDPGMRIYDITSWTDRYASKILSSHGHAVPVVNGKLQGVGKQFAAELVTDTESSVTLDLAKAYSDDTLVLLERRLELIPGGYGTVEVEDTFEYSTDGEFETVLVSFSTVKKISDDELLIKGKTQSLIVTIDASGETELSFEEIHDNLPWELVPMRVGIRLKDKSKAGFIRLSYSPSRPADQREAG